MVVEFSTEMRRGRERGFPCARSHAHTQILDGSFGSEACPRVSLDEVVGANTKKTAAEQPISTVLEGKARTSLYKRHKNSTEKEELTVLIPQQCWKSAHTHRVMAETQTYLTWLKMRSLRNLRNLECL